ncbi:hypothetical protein [Nesterenkonia suensis]
MTMVRQAWVLTRTLRISVVRQLFGSDPGDGVRRRWVWAGVGALVLGYQAAIFAMAHWTAGSVAGHEGLAGTYYHLMIVLYVALTAAVCGCLSILAGNAVVTLAVIRGVSRIGLMVRLPREAADAVGLSTVFAGAGVVVWIGVLHPDAMTDGAILFRWSQGLALGAPGAVVGLVGLGLLGAAAWFASLSLSPAPSVSSPSGGTGLTVVRIIDWLSVGWLRGPVSLEVRQILRAPIVSLALNILLVTGALALVVSLLRPGGGTWIAEAGVLPTYVGVQVSLITALAAYGATNRSHWLHHVYLGRAAWQVPKAAAVMSIVACVVGVTTVLAVWAGYQNVSIQTLLVPLAACSVGYAVGGLLPVDSREPGAFVASLLIAAAATFLALVVFTELPGAVYDALYVLILGGASWLVVRLVVARRETRRPLTHT